MRFEIQSDNELGILSGLFRANLVRIDYKRRRIVYTSTGRRYRGTRFMEIKAQVYVERINTLTQIESINWVLKEAQEDLENPTEYFPTFL